MISEARRIKIIEEWKVKINYHNWIGNIKYM